MKIFEVNQSNNKPKHATYSLIATVFVALMTTSVLAHADSEQKYCGHQRWSQEGRSEHFQKRQQELHDKLAITANQEAAWNTFVEKTKPGEKSGEKVGERHEKADWSELSKLSTPERLDLMLAKAKEREQRFAVHVQATKDLYQQLTPAQQKVFDTLHQHHRDENRRN